MPLRISRKLLQVILTQTIAMVAMCALPSTAAPLSPPEKAAVARASSTGKPSYVGHVDGARDIPIETVLQLHNQTDLGTLLHRLYNPKDPLYGKYISAGDFTDRFGPTQADVDAVAKFLTAKGFHVHGASRITGLVSADAPAGTIEKTFQVTLGEYASPTGRIFHKADRTETLSSTLKSRVAVVLGLDTSSEPTTPGPRVSNTHGLFQYGGNDGMSPSDIISIYNTGPVGTTAKGAGQVLALFEMGTYTAADVQTYASYYNLSLPTINNIGVDGYSTDPTVDYPDPNTLPEIDLDIELMTALSDQANQIQVYENDPYVGIGGFYQSLIDTFTEMATINVTSNGAIPRPNVISVSYGASEFGFSEGMYPGSASPAQMVAENAALARLAAQGQTVCVSSGDRGAWTAGLPTGPYPVNVSDPASQPYVLSVGGTTLGDSATAPYQWTSETSWWYPNYDEGGGGGVSDLWTIPYWQVGSFSTTVNPQGSTTMRNVPDVALDSDPSTGYSIYSSYFLNHGTDTGWEQLGGTSCAGPVWAAFLADVNGMRAAQNPPIAPVGFVNPTIYALAENPTTYAADFHDVADGSTNGYYTTVHGYDNSTGWGSFNGSALAASLTTASTTTLVGSTTTLAASANPVNTGQTVTFTATVSGADGGTPTGSLTFYGVLPSEDNDSLDIVGLSSVTVPLVGNTATWTGPMTPNGEITPIPISAVYDGNSTYYESVSNTIQEAVNYVDPTTTTLTAATLDPIIGQPAYFTATVTTAGPDTVPQGTISVWDTDDIGWGTYNLVPNPNGPGAIANIDIDGPDLPFRSRTLQAFYSGNGNWSPSISNPVTVYVACASSTTVTSNANPALSGQSVTLTANVKDLTQPVTATGYVTFSGVPGGPVNVNLVNQSASWTGVLPSGNNQITVTFPGDTLGLIFGSSTTFTQQVYYPETMYAFCPTGIGIEPSNNQYQIDLWPQGSGAGTPPTGTIQAYTASGTYLGSTNLVTSGPGAIATFNAAASLPLGSNSLVFKYGGDSNYQPNSCSLTVNVISGTSTTLTSSANPSANNQSITLTAAVAPLVSGGPAPTGSVTFYGLPAGTTSEPLVNGVATWTGTLSTTGTYTVTAEYTGDSHNWQSGSSIRQVVDYPETMYGFCPTGVAVAPQNEQVQIDLFPQGSGAGTPPTGAVQAYTTSGTSLGSANLVTSGPGAIATFNASGLLPLGSNTLVFKYPGDANYQPNSCNVTFNVISGTSTTLTSSTNPSTNNQTITLTATVAVLVSGGAAPTGSVTFYGISGSGIGEPLVNGVATWTGALSSTGGSNGTYSLRATYPGDSNNGMSSTTLTQVVNP